MGRAGQHLLTQQSAESRLLPAGALAVAGLGVGMVRSHSSTIPATPSPCSRTPSRSPAPSVRRSSRAWPWCRCCPPPSAPTITAAPPETVPVVVGHWQRLGSMWVSSGPRCASSPNCSSAFVSTRTLPTCSQQPTRTRGTPPRWPAPMRNGGRYLRETMRTRLGDRRTRAARRTASDSPGLRSSPTPS